MSEQPTTSTELAPAKSKGGRPPSYTEEQVRRSLLVLAAHGGNTVAASKQLAQDGHPTPSSTLYFWRTERHPELYNKLHEQYGREIETALIPQIRDTAVLAAEGTRKAVQASLDQLDTGTVKDPGTLARNLATTAAINIDKLMLMTNRPTEIREHRDIAGILRSLANNIPGVHTQDTTSEDITDAVTG